MEKDNPDMERDVALAQTGADAIVPGDEQPMPEDILDEPMELKSGSFITIDPVHDAEESETIYELTVCSLALYLALLILRHNLRGKLCPYHTHLFKVAVSPLAINHRA